VVLTASRAGGRGAERSARVYSGSGLYQHDTMLKALRRMPPGNEAPLLLHTRRSDISDAAYGTQLWDRFDLIDRLSALDAHEGPWTALNLYRDRATTAFADVQRRRFAALAPLLLALLRRHLATLQTDTHAMSRCARSRDRALKRLPTRLSARDRVCAMTLAATRVRHRAASASPRAASQRCASGRIASYRYTVLQNCSRCAYPTPPRPT
jgi:hypothetical protein